MIANPADSMNNATNPETKKGEKKTTPITAMAVNPLNNDTPAAVTTVDIVASNTRQT